MRPEPERFGEVLLGGVLVADAQVRHPACQVRSFVLRVKLYRPVEAVEIMIEASVVPVLAHPLTMNIEFDAIERFADELAEAGLKGIEGYHGDWTLEEQEPLRTYADRKGLIASGGSDYHGDMRPDRTLPGGKSGVTVPPEVLDEFERCFEDWSLAAEVEPFVWTREVDDVVLRALMTYWFNLAQMLADHPEHQPPGSLEARVFYRTLVAAILAQLADTD